MLYVLLYYPNKALVIVYTLSCWLILSLFLSDLVYFNCQKKKKIMRVGNSSMNVSTTSVDPEVSQFPAKLPPSMDQDAESMSF